MVEEVATCNCERWQTLEWSMNTLTLMSPIPTIAQSRNKCLRVIFSLENDMRSFVSCCVSIFNYNICSVCDESMKKSQGCGMKLEKKKGTQSEKCFTQKEKPQCFFLCSTSMRTPTDMRSERESSPPFFGYCVVGTLSVWHFDRSTNNWTPKTYLSWCLMFKLYYVMSFFDKSSQIVNHELWA